MPSIKKGESEDDYIKRCIPYLVEKEGKSPDQAAAQCHGMWKEHKEKGTQYSDDEDREFTVTMTLQIFEKPSTIDSTTEQPTIQETEDWVTVRATAVIGNRMMNGFFLPYSELKKSLDMWEGTYHDISHLGTSYPDNTPPFKRENLEYIIGYQNNAKADDVTKEISMDVNIYKKSEKYQSWKSFIDINKAANKIPNVSVAILATPKMIKASEIDCSESFGFKKDEMVLCLTNIIPKALTTCIKGACDDKKGCGINRSYTEETIDEKPNCDCKDKKCDEETQPSTVGDSEKVSDEDAKKLAYYQQRIKQLKEEK